MIGAVKKWVFGERCSVTWCLRAPDIFMRISAGVRIIYIPYCDRHARVADMLFRSGEIKLDIPADYTPL